MKLFGIVGAACALVCGALHAQTFPAGPMRLIVPGWVGSASTKWVNTITVLDAPFKGTYMDSSYRIPRTPVKPITNTVRQDG